MWGRRFVTLAAIFVMVILSACGGGPAPAPATPTTPAPVTLSTQAPPTPVPTQPTAVPPPPTPTRAPLPPTVVSVKPERGEEQLLSGPVVITFDQPMDAASTSAAFSIEPDVPGEVKVNGNQLTFSPAEQLQRDASYKVTLAAGAASAAGLALPNPISFRFVTAGFLRVTSSQPSHGAVDVAVDDAVTVVFNRPVVPLTGVADQAALPQPLSITPALTGKGEWLNTSIYRFSPTVGLAASTEYSVTVAAGLEDTAGGTLADPFVFSFRTADPTVLRWLPENQLTMGITRPISVTFSMPMDRAATESSFSVTDGTGANVPGRITWSADGTELGFRPSQRFAFDTLYRALVSTSARPASGGGGLRTTAPLEATFRTVPLPKILRSDPSAGSTNASPDGGVRIDFASPMNPKSFISGSVTILPKPTQVYTYYNEYENSFFLDFPKLPASDYVVTLSGKVADPYGNTLGKDQLIRFHTRDYDPLERLNSATQVGTYNAYTNTFAVVTYRNMPQIGLALYRVGAEQFLQLTGRESWQAWENYRPNPADLVSRWTVPTKGARNKLAMLSTELKDGEGNALGAGLYYLELDGARAESGQRNERRQLLVRATFNVTLKAGASDGLAWVTDLKTGLPVSGARVRFADGSRNDVVATTGADGVARATLQGRQMYDPLLAVATTDGGGFGVASTNWSDGISPWEFQIQQGANDLKYMSYVYTDRPLYRPGQTVYWKAIVRADTDAQYSLPAPGVPISVTVNDEQGTVVLQQSLTLDPVGTLHGKLELGQDAALGYYYLSLRTRDDTSLNGISFLVAEYRKPDYELAATVAKSDYVHGEQIEVKVQGNYFFGGPVQNAKVNWVLLSNDFPFNYTGEGFYSFSDWEYFAAPVTPFNGVINQGEGRTDGQGSFSFFVPANIARFPQSQRFTFDITLLDVNNQSVSTQAVAIVHKGQFYIGLAPQEYVAKTGESQRVDVVTVDIKGRPAPQKKVELVVNKVEWSSVREELEDGRFYWVSRPRKTAVLTETVTTDAAGRGWLDWRPPDAGEYKIEATSRDDGGRVIRSAAYVWVTGTKYVPWRQENNDRINLVADKEEYLPGETAEILIPSPYAGPVQALVTVERGAVLEYQVVELRGNSVTLPIKIGPRFAPNVVVSVVILKGMDEATPNPSFKVGMVPLRISVADKELEITLTARRGATMEGQPAAFAPREKVTWDVETRNAAGQPVAAQVSLALVDKALLSLAEDQAGSIVRRFYSERFLGIATGISLVLSVDRLVAQLAESGKGGGGGGGGVGPTSVRSEFLDLAYWNAVVQTGPDGKATVEVTLPDNLTTWVMDARAVTEDTLVGQAKAEIMTTKPMLVRPVLPRFFVAGDKAEIAAVVHNTTASALDVAIELKATGLELPTGGTALTVSVPSGETYKATWNVSVASTAAEVTVVMSASAQAARLEDAVELKIPVLRYSSPEVTATAGQVEADETRIELVRLPENADKTRAALDVTLEPSLAAGMVGGLTFLEHYPYECIEQTVSRFLPNVVTYQALKRLGIERPDLDAALPQQVGVGLQRIYSNQHLDGGWGWWQRDESNLTVSAYVVFGMAQSQKAGFAVDPQVLNRGIQFLRRGLAAPAGLKDWQLNRQALLLYALSEAGQPEPNRAGALFEARERLSSYARAFLALALDGIDDAAAPDRIKTLLADITGKAVVSATSANWEEGWTDFRNMNTDTRSTAVVIAALSRLDPANALGPNAVRWLMNVRRGDRWDTTQENAWAIIALTEWMAATGELNGDYTWQVSLNEKPLGEGTVTPDTVRDVKSVRAGVESLLLDATNGLLITRSKASGQTGDGRLYYTARLMSYLPVADLPPVSRGLTVSRLYQRDDCLNPRPLPGQPAPTTKPEDCPAITSAAVGDVIQVKLTVVVPEEASYLIVEDPIPAGTEGIDTSLRTTSLLIEGPGMDKQSKAGKWNWWWSPTHSELRDEKAVLFADSLTPGTYDFTYQVRASLPGEFLTLPTTASLMYFPEVWGRGSGGVFKITE